MKELFSLMAKIDVNNGEAIADIKSVDKQGAKTSTNLSDNFSKVGKVIKTSLIAGTVALIGIMAKLGTDGVRNIIDIQDATKRYQVETGASIQSAEKFSETITKLHKVNTDSYAEIGNAVISFRQKFGELGKDTIKYTQSFLDFAKITRQDTGEAIKNIDAILKAFNLTLSDSPLLMDKLKKAQQLTGVSTASLQKTLASGSVAFQAMGMDIDKSIGFISSFEKQGVSAAAIVKGLTNVIRYAQQPSSEYAESFEALGVAVDKAGKPIGGAEEVIKKLQLVMSKGTITQEEMAAASTLLGSKIAGDMVRGLKSGQGAIEELTKKINNSAGTVKEASDIFDKQIGERWELLKRKYIEPFAESVGSKIVNALEVSLPVLKNWTTTATNYISDFATETKGIISDWLKTSQDNFSNWGKSLYDATSATKKYFENVKLGWIAIASPEKFDAYLSRLQSVKEFEDKAWQFRNKKIKENVKTEIKQQKKLAEEEINIKKTLNTTFADMEKNLSDKVVFIMQDKEDKKVKIVKKSSEEQKETITSMVLDVVDNYKKMSDSNLITLESFKNAGSIIWDSFNSETAQKIQTFAVESGSMLGSLMSDVTSGIINTTQAAADKEYKMADDLENHLSYSLQKFLGNVDGFKGAFNGLKGFFNDFLGFFKQKFLSQIASGLTDTLMDALGMASGGGKKQSSGGFLGTIGAAFGPIGGVVGNLLGGLFHEGGVVGETNVPTRELPISTWVNAPKMHDGGLVGNEVPAILQKGEEVLTANNPRHMNNSGGYDTANISVFLDGRAIMQSVKTMLVKDIRLSTGVRR